MTSLLRMSARLGALLIAIAASKAALAETAVPFEQVFNLGNDQGIRIELDPSDDVLVFNGGTYILWGRNLEIYAGRIQVNADTIIQAFPRGTVADLSSDGAPGAAGANGGAGGPGYPGIAAGTVLIRATSIEGSGRLIILNDGMDGGAGGHGGPGGPGALGGPGTDTQCKCEASSCAVSSCLGSILPETGAAAVDDPVVAQSMAGYLKLMQDAKILRSQPGRESKIRAVAAVLPDLHADHDRLERRAGRQGRRRRQWRRRRQRRHRRQRRLRAGSARRVRPRPDRHLGLRRRRRQAGQARRRRRRRARRPRRHERLRTAVALRARRQGRFRRPRQTRLRRRQRQAGQSLRHPGLILVIQD